jgi:hypothetical protein
VRPAVRDLAIVLIVSWLARALFIAAIGDAHSSDVGHWEGALEALDEGRNPYETGVLNWPPLWLVVIAGLDTAANRIDVSFWTTLRVYLVAVESVLVVSLYLLLVSAGTARKRVFRALLVGIALNPIAILLVCQHGNSDVQIGLLVTLAVAALVVHERSRDVVYWLLGCLMLGLGVLAKTVPLVLAPILAPGARLTSRAGKGLGAVLLLGPAALGMAVILALAPVPVIDHVIRYRSTRGFFGIGGVLDEEFFGFAGWVKEITGVDARLWHERLFTVAVVVAMLWLGRRLWSAPPLAADRLFLLVATILMGVVALGPGYGPQYAYWFLPALVATYVLLDRRWRQLLGLAYVVAALTYAVEYALIPWLGAYAVAIAGSSDRLTDASEWLDTPEHLTLVRLPLLAVYVILIAAGIRRLANPGRYDAKL